MKKIALLIICIFIISCQEKFNPEEFKGTWGNVYDDNVEWKFKPTIIFKKDSIFFQDLYSFSINAKYKIDQNKIKLYFKKNTVDYKISFNRKDSILTINNRNYDFYEDFSFYKNLKTYKLINLEREKNITADSLSRFELGFHLFKNERDITMLKLNDDITTDFSSFHEFTHNNLRIHFDLLGMVVYVGKDIELKDLIKLYREISYINRKKVFLITGFNLEKNLYGGFIDRIYFWNSQLESIKNEHFKKPHLFEGNKENFISKYNPKIIIINSRKDLKKLNSINKKDKYLISISSNLTIEDYINLKERIFNIDKNIRTEFILD